MVASELDTPPLTAPAIATRRFSLARRGYDTEEVHRFLAQVGEQVRRLESDLARQRARSELLERKVSAAQEAAYARVFRRLLEVMRAAEEAASRIRALAEQEARSTISAAKAEAELIEGAARAEAGRPRERGVEEGPPPADAWWGTPSAGGASPEASSPADVFDEDDLAIDFDLLWESEEGRS